MRVLAADAGDHFGRECRPAAEWRSSPPLRPRLVLALGEIALELGDRDQPRPPFGLDGGDRGHDAPSSVARLTPSACAACSRVYASGWTCPAS
jgi:hypothetical protein